MTKKKLAKLPDESLLKALSVDDGEKWIASQQYHRRTRVAQDAKEQHTAAMSGLLERDVRQVLWFRPVASGFFAFLLMGQNWAVYKIVVASSILKVDGTFLSILIAGTLAETYGIIHIIVRFLFREKDYTPNHERKHR